MKVTWAFKNTQMDRKAVGKGWEDGMMLLDYSQTWLPHKIGSLCWVQFTEWDVSQSWGTFDYWQKWSCWGIMELFKVLCVYCKGGVMWLFPSHLHDHIPTIIAYAHNAWRHKHSTRAFMMTHIQTMNLMRACCDQVFKLTLTYEENTLLFSRDQNAPAFVFVRIFPAFLFSSKSHLEPTLSQTDFTFPLRHRKTWHRCTNQPDGSYHTQLCFTQEVLTGFWISILFYFMADYI